MARVNNLARVVTATTGTGTLTLGAAVSGFLTFAQAGFTDGTWVEYSINETGQSEKGVGQYSTTGPTLSRVFVFSSTNGNALVNLTTANAQVFCDPSAQHLWVINHNQHANYGGI